MKNSWHSNRKDPSKEYQSSFEVLASPLQNLPEQLLEGIFINGLKPKIRAEVSLLKPVGLGHIMETAQRVEDRNELLKVDHNATGPICSRGTTAGSPYSQTGLHNSINPAPNSTPKSMPITAIRTPNPA